VESHAEQAQLGKGKRSIRAPRRNGFAFVDASFGRALTSGRNLAVPRRTTVVSRGDGPRRIEFPVNDTAPLPRSSKSTNLTTAEPIFGKCR
jgi:hypothetical protein